jgi:hypothetical protein
VSKRLSPIAARFQDLIFSLTTLNVPPAPSSWLTLTKVARFNRTLESSVPSSTTGATMLKAAACPGRESQCSIGAKHISSESSFLIPCESSPNHHKLM